MSTKEDLEEISTIADTLTKQTAMETRAAEERRGEQGRIHFAPLRKQLVRVLGELNKMRPGALKARAAGEKILQSGVFLGAIQRRALETHVSELSGAVTGRYANSVRSAIAAIDGIGTDNPAYWPRDDFAGGALATLGSAQRHIDGVVKLIKEIGQDATVGPVREVEDHPLAVEDETERRERVEVVSNMPADMLR